MPTARKKLKKQTFEERVRVLAGYFERSEGTIRQWAREGCDLWDMSPDSPKGVIAFWQWKNSRARNKPNQERPARRIRPPCS